MGPVEGFLPTDELLVKGVFKIVKTVFFERIHGACIFNDQRWCYTFAPIFLLDMSLKKLAIYHSGIVRGV